MFNPLDTSPTPTLPSKDVLLNELDVSLDSIENGLYVARAGSRGEYQTFAERLEPIPTSIRLGEDGQATGICLPAGVGHHLFGEDPDPWPGDELPPGEFQGSLYGESPDQCGVVSNTVDALRRRRFATIESPVGSGKTVMVTKIIMEMGVKALFVTTTTNLLEQAKTQGFNVFAPHLKVGQLRGSRYGPVEDCDVVLCCPRTLVSRQDPAWLSRFGLIVFDEAHKAATNEMLQAGAKLRCKYRLGVSATLRRNDDKYLLIPAILGDVATRLSRVWAGVRYVSHMMAYADHPNKELPLKTQKWGKFKGKCDMHKFLEDITTHPGRRELVCQSIKRDLEDRGKLFVFGDRIEYLEGIQQRLHELGITSGVLCMRSNKGDALLETLSHRVILSTYGSGVEGVNDKEVDTIYFAMPFSNASTCRVEQSIGRCRPGPGKPIPLVRDFVDRCALGYAMHRKRTAAANHLNAEHTKSFHDI